MAHIRYIAYVYNIIVVRSLNASSVRATGTIGSRDAFIVRETVATLTVLVTISFCRLYKGLHEEFAFKGASADTHR